MTEEYCEICGKKHGLREIMQERAEAYIYNKFREVLSEALILALLFRQTRSDITDEYVEKLCGVQAEINKFIVNIIEEKKDLDMKADDIYLILLQLIVQNLMFTEQMWSKEREKSEIRRKFLSKEGSEYG